jgi:hypothetical protein
LKPTISTFRGLSCLLFFAAVFLISCNKEPDEIGLDLLPGGDRLNALHMDTTTVVAYSVYDDSVRTDELVLYQALVGSVFDPVFGKTAATFYTQLQMTKAAPNFGTNPVCDSLVLILPYVSLFGDTTALQTFKVYELSQALAKESVYTSNMHADYNLSLLLAEQTFLPRVKDSIQLDSTHRVIPQLRLKFNAVLGNKILAASANDLLNNDNFFKFFKGMAITANDVNTPGKGSLVSFNLISASTGMRMYYHNTTDTAFFDMTIGKSCAYFNQYNHFGHQNASPEFRAQLSGDKTLGQQKLYVQALGGTKVKLSFPYLKKWSSSQKISINEAQLIMTNADPAASYIPPVQLSLLVRYKNGSVDYTADEKEKQVNYYDGRYNSAKGYRFRISRYIQQFLNPQANPLLENDGLYLAVPNVISAVSQYNRLILNGTGSQLPGRFKLAITYTTVPQ